EALAKKLASICRVTGSTQADGARLVDADEARREMEIPSGKAVVVYLPTSASGASLYEKVFIASSKFRQAAFIMRARQWRNLRCLLQPFSDKALVKSVRRFCDANDAFLLVKTRRKQPLPDYLEHAADRIVFDETEYPATILKTLSVASLCVSAYPSSSINDAAAMGVPFLCFYRDDRFWPYSFRNNSYVRSPGEVLFDIRESDYFNYPGFAYAMHDVDAINRLPGLAISDFVLDGKARQSFVEKFIGALDGKNGHRIVDEVEALLESRVRQARTC
ncbi:MAG: hypothetical protein L0177_03160, partial [Chloroflexi bacterium]|nr:hypothetical protein [Chloroflexota bacterium]